MTYISFGVAGIIMGAIYHIQAIGAKVKTAYANVCVAYDVLPFAEASSSLVEIGQSGNVPHGFAV